MFQTTDKSLAGNANGLLFIHDTQEFHVLDICLRPLEILVHAFGGYAAYDFSVYLSE